MAELTKHQLDVLAAHARILKSTGAACVVTPEELIELVIGYRSALKSREVLQQFLRDNPELLRLAPNLKRLL